MSADNYYVYILAYPESMGGHVFYVGKGRRYTNLQDRIDDHEKQALGKRPASNAQKVAIICSILAEGERVVTRKVAFFDNEQDALLYEWALIHMTCYADTLTNKSTMGPAQPIKRLPDLPQIEMPICIWHRGRKGYTIHRVEDAEWFISRYAIKRSSMLRLLQTGEIPTWKIVDCQCATA